MRYKKIASYKFDCDACPTRCDGKTVEQFDFERDVNFSEAIENRVISYINEKFPNLFASKTELPGYPDIEIKSRKTNKILLYIEIKGQARTFMSIRRVLPHSGLIPSETLACNLSDLERYFTIKDDIQIPIFITWCLIRRPCITGPNPEFKRFYSQDIEVLRTIRTDDSTDSRRFRRASGKGDVVDGEHRGVVVNYHFSLNEFFSGLPDLKSFDELG